MFAYMIILFLIFIIQFSVSCAALSVSDETEKQIVIDVSIREAIVGFSLSEWINEYDTYENNSAITFCRLIIYELYFMRNLKKYI